MMRLGKAQIEALTVGGGGGGGGVAHGGEGRERVINTCGGGPGSIREWSLITERGLQTGG